MYTHISGIERVKERCILTVSMRSNELIIVIYYFVSLIAKCMIKVNNH